MQKRTADLGVAPLGPLLFRLSLPAIVGMAVMALYNIIDTFWVARLGEKAVAALTIVFPWQMLIGAIGVGTGVGVSSLVARRFGEGRGEGANRVGGQVLVLAGTVGPLLTATALLFSRPVVRLFGATPDLEALATSYLTAVAFGVPFVLFMMSTSGLYRGSGNTLFPTLTMSTSAALNMGLAPFLIFGWGPFREMGVRGAGWATAISQFSASFMAATYLWSRYSGFQVRRRHLRPHWPTIRDIFQVGAPAMAMQLVGTVVISLYNDVLGHFGDTAIAAYGLTFRMMAMVFMPFFGIAQGLLPIVGFNYGARQYQRMWGAIRFASAVTGGVGFLLGALLWVFAPGAVHVFTREPQWVPLTVMAIRFTVVTMWLVGPQVMFISAVQGMGHGTHALLLSLTRQLVFLVPGLYVLSHYFGIEGAFASQPLADFFSFLATLVLFVYMVRRYRPEPAALAEARLVAGEAEGAK